MHLAKIQSTFFLATIHRGVSATNPLQDDDLRGTEAQSFNLLDISSGKPEKQGNLFRRTSPARWPLKKRFHGAPAERQTPI